jgi:hypothetical protein
MRGSCDLNDFLKNFSLDPKIGHSEPYGELREAELGGLQPLKFDTLPIFLVSMRPGPERAFWRSALRAISFGP